MRTLAGLTLLIAGVWVFPTLWYTRSDPSQAVQWLGEQTNAPGWRYESVAVDESAEKLLVADRLVVGKFTRDGNSLDIIRVFGTRRTKEDPKEIGLFVHTPDRCWVQGGWNLAETTPDFVEVRLHGRRIGFERRLFEFRGRRELVYFTGLVGGQTLPYRLDHNYSVSRRVVATGEEDRIHRANRWNDPLFWRRLLDSFLSRRPLLGPKQFLRISTPIQGGDIIMADRRIMELLPGWLQPEVVAGIE
jgi:hypothetical protein